ncbi:MAG: purine-binding chemotaxis protein CheW [Myxococcales bacterium FL481]|nr:MAG: purine-binding chemotaxis protein CheW [Myxococcales bacterium FL481]
MGQEQSLLPDDSIAAEGEDTQAGKYLTFILEGQSYGLEIKHVTEIIGLQEITDIPDVPDFVKGIINLRGKVIPIMDVRCRFHMPPRDYDERTCIIVIQVRDSAVGLLVDTVSEVLDIADNNIEPPPSVGGDGGHGFMRGVGKTEDSVKLLLDAERLLYGDELEEVQQALAS